MTTKKIIYVDAFKIRMNLDLEFGCCHEKCIDYNYYAPKFYIPEDEIWIDYRFKSEQEMLVRLETEVVAGDTTCERRESRKKIFLTNGSIPNFKLSTASRDGLKYVKVDGSVVRKFIDPEFIQGGHGIVYDFVPKDEVWVDAINDVAELDFIYHHELLERRLMEKGDIYDNSHDAALAAERKERREAGACYPGDEKYVARQISDFYV
ncbi:MAG: hypothetical protein HZA95_03240 [Candidatus Vogelbacteria bacterium]|nr:hypothetical protein [Candidatus Vogelbacteria bacterium]